MSNRDIGGAILQMNPFVAVDRSVSEFNAESMALSVERFRLESELIAKM